MNDIELSDLLVALKRELATFALRGRLDGEVPLYVRELEIEITTCAVPSPASDAPVALRIVDGESSSRASHTQRITIRLTPHRPLELGGETA